MRNSRATALFSLSRSRVTGFTLIELLIVAALLTIFASLAIISAQHFFDEGKRRAIFDETKQIGTAASFAEQDIAVFPRLNVLTYPKNLISAAGNGGTLLIRPGMDTYGYLGENSPLNSSILSKWAGGYLSVNQARTRLSQGASGLTKMRFPERSLNASAWVNQGIADITIDDWPVDAWGNPYVMYLVVADPLVRRGNNTQGLRLISRPNESVNYMAAVVSYGQNGVPGGVPNEFIASTIHSQTEIDDARQWIDTMRRARLYIVNNNNAEPITLNDAEAKFTLRSFNSSLAIPQASLRTDTEFQTWFPDSVSNMTNPGAPTRPGIRDAGSDDIIWTF